MIAASGIKKQMGSKVLYRNGSFQINPGEKIGLVGPNGAGKSTLFKLILKEESVDEGTVTVPEKLKIGYFSQDIADMRGRTVLEEVKSSAGSLEKIQARIKEIEILLATDLTPEKMEKLLEEYGSLTSQFEEAGGYTLETEAQEILTGLGFPPDEHNRMTESYSGGWKMRIALAKILALRPDVLLMDEPTNHLDLESILWLENWLKSYKGALFMTSHDREFMNRIVTKIVEVAYQSITVYSGNYDYYEKERKIRMTQLIAASKRQEDMLAKEEEFIARFAARASHAAQVQSRVKKIEKIDRIEIPTEEKTVDLVWAPAPRGGDEVYKVQNLGMTYKTGDREKKVFSGANALIKRQNKVALVGVNGAGKSTFLKIAQGVIKATEGESAIGQNLKVGYFSQNSLETLNPENTVLGEMESQFPQMNIGNIRAILGALKFSGDDVEKKVSVLSGGEKSRLVLATIVAEPVNFLILDEPTNHLDIASRDVLLKALQDFDGTILIVSHDRHFLKQLTNRVFELDRHELIVWTGTYEEYLEKKTKQLT